MGLHVLPSNLEQARLCWAGPKCSALLITTVLSVCKIYLLSTLACIVGLGPACLLLHAWLQARGTRKWADIFSAPPLRTLFDRETEDLVTRRGGRPRRTQDEILQQMRLHNSWYYGKSLLGYRKPLSGRTVRLLRIHPGAFDDPIRCTLEPRRLGSTPGRTRFAAVSYAWGDLRRLRAITVDGVHGFVVSESAHQVLRRVRAAAAAARDQKLRHQCEYVWVDAICINQSLNAERAHQVGLMDRIYSTASTVYVYLGPCNHSGDRRRDVDVVACNRHSSAMIWNWTCHEDELAPATPAECWLREVEPYHSQWWNRVWTVQETVLARNLQVLLGPHTLRWAELMTVVRSRRLPGAACNAITALDDLRSKWCLRREKYEETHGGGVDEFAESGDDEDYEESEDDESETPQRNMRGKVGLKLSELLQRTACRHASDPLDKIYGLLGMAINPVVADYGMSIERLNVQVTRHIIETERSLDVLLLGNWPRIRPQRPGEASLTDYPRWALQFHEPSPHASPRDLYRAATGKMPAASRPGPFAVKVDFANNIRLCCQGAVFDSVLLAISCRDASAARIDLGRPFTLDGSPHIPLPDHAGRVSVLAREMQCLTHKLVTRIPPWHSKAARPFRWERNGIGDWNLMDRPRLKGSRHLLRKFSASLTRISRKIPAETGPPDATFKRYAQHCLDLPNTSFFVTREGFIGVAYDGPLRVKEPADTVAVLYGASMPLVLRNVNVEGHSEEFSIVAGAYVSCLMKGELLDLCEDRRSFTIA